MFGIFRKKEPWSLTLEGVQAKAEPKIIKKQPRRIVVLNVMTADELILLNNDLITKIKYEFGINTLYPWIEEAIVNLSEFAQLLPASESQHHANTGGLFRHSLEVAIKAAEYRKGVTMPEYVPSPMRQKLRDQWSCAFFLAGLFHDVGKLASDLRVTSVDGKKEWTVFGNSLFAWAKENGFKQYTFEFQTSREHKDHEIMTPVFVDRMMPLKTKEYFNSVDTVVLKTILKTLQGYKNDMTQEVIRADKYSSQQYMLNEAAHQSNLSGKPSIHTHVVNAIKDAIEKDSDWKLNQKNVLRIPSREGVHTEGVFVNANEAMKVTLAYLAGTKFAKIGNELSDFVRILSDIDWVKVYLSADGKNWLWPVTVITDEKEISGKYLFFDNTKRILDDFDPEDLVDGWVGKKPATYKPLAQPDEKEQKVAATEEPLANDTQEQEVANQDDKKAEGANNAVADLIQKEADKTLNDAVFAMPDMLPVSRKKNVSEPTEGTNTGENARTPVANDTVVPQENKSDAVSSDSLLAFGAEFSLRPKQRTSEEDQAPRTSASPAVTESNSTTIEVPEAVGDEQGQILTDFKQTGPAGEWIAEQLNSIGCGILLLGSTIIKQGNYYVIRKSKSAPTMAQRIKEGIQDQDTAHLSDQVSQKIQAYIDQISAQRLPAAHNMFHVEAITMDSLRSMADTKETTDAQEEQQKLFDAGETDAAKEQPRDDDDMEYEIPTNIVKEEFRVDESQSRKRKSWREKQEERKAIVEDELSMRINGLGKLTRSETLGGLAKQAEESLKAIKSKKEAEAKADPKPVPDGYDPLELNGINLTGVDEAEHRLNISKAIAIRLIDMIVDESGDWLVSPVEREEDGTLKTSVACLKNLEVAYPKKFSVKVVIGLMRTQAKQRGFNLQKKHAQIILIPKGVQSWP